MAVNSKKRLREFKRGVLRVHGEGQGVFRIEAFDVEAVAGLLLARGIGEEGARRRVEILGQFLRGLLAADPALLCLLCESELTVRRLPRLFVMMTGYCEEPGEAIVNGVCEVCSGLGDLQAAVIAKYRESLLPDLRVLPEISTAGRA